MQIQVYQGERDIAAYNKKLGMFELTGIPPAPQRVPQIEVTFDIDANGIVNVHAKDLGTGKAQSMVVTGGSALGKEEIDRMVREAEQYAAEDRERRESAEVRNQAETVAYQTEKFLKENSEKIPDDIKTEVESAVSDLKKALEGDDVEAIKAATEQVGEASQKIGTALYAQAQAQAAAEGAGAEEDQASSTASATAADADAGDSAASDEDVVDAEIVDDDTEKK